MGKSFMSPGIWDIVSSEGAITACLIIITLTIVLRIFVWKERLAVQDLIVVGLCLFVGTDTFGSLYARYGWGWIQKGQWAGVLYGIVFFGVAAWIGKKMVEKSGK